MTKRLYGVRLPIAGHAYLEIAASSEEEAIAAAFEKVTTKDLETWDALDRFAQGNVLYCPHPWEPEAEDIGEADDE